MMSPSSAIQQAASAYFYVAVWMSISIGVILFNKWLLAFAGFPFPITLTLWHMFFCSVAGFICVRVLKITKSFNLSVEEYVTRVMPIGKCRLSCPTVLEEGAGAVPETSPDDCRSPIRCQPVVKQLFLPLSVGIIHPDDQVLDAGLGVLLRLSRWYREVQVEYSPGHDPHSCRSCCLRVWRGEFDPRWSRHSAHSLAV